MFLQISVCTKDSLENPQGKTLDSQQRDERWVSCLKTMSLSLLLVHLMSGSLTGLTRFITAPGCWRETNDSWFYSQLPELLHRLPSEGSHESEEHSVTGSPVKSQSSFSSCPRNGTLSILPLIDT